MQKVKNAVLNFIIPLGALGASLVLFIIIIYPTMKNLPILREELASKSALENQLRTKLSTLNKLVDFEAVVQENSDLVRRVLVPDPAVPELLTQVDMVARESGLEVNKLSYSFGEATEVESLLPHATINVSLGVVGNYDQLNTFLTNLENSARLVNVTSFRFAKGGVATAEGVFNATLILSSPYQAIASEAVTDDPVNVDVSDPDFIAVLDEIKKLRFYNISIDTRFEDIEESSSEEIEGSIEEEEVPEGDIDVEDLPGVPPR